MKNISNTELKKAVLSSLSPELVKCGFSFKLKNNLFIRRRGEVTDQFQLVWLDAKPGYRIQPNVGVRIEQVEDIFHQTSGFESKYQKDTPTMGNSIGIFLTGDSRDCEFLLESKSEADSTAEKIAGVFREFALPYFERWGSLTAIDAELNNKRGERTHQRVGAWFRCSTGIIVAKLVGRPDYEQLAAFYAEIMTQDNKGFYLKRFQALVKSLESVESGSGLAK
jgi:hypothetical protein